MKGTKKDKDLLLLICSKKDKKDKKRQKTSRVPLGFLYPLGIF
jgi:hypothetical protein